MMKTSIKDCQLISLNTISQPSGDLTFIEGNQHIPFQIKRIFYVYDVPNDNHRGAHAHQQLQQLMICLAGNLDVLIDDGTAKTTIHLNKPHQGLYIPPMIWSSQINFCANAICLVLASENYYEKDYLRDYEQFVNAKGVS
jgi:hypothetical protein